MSRETKTARQARALRVLAQLGQDMPEARIELDFTSPLELLIAVILSAQCTDKRVNLTTPALFQRFPTAEAFARAAPGEIEPLIKSCGFFRHKAKNIQATASILVEQYGGKVPLSREALGKLPGVGQKTAGVVAIHIGGEPAFPVDTHVGRLSRRLGFTTEEDPDKVEADLQALLPRDTWNQGHQLLVWHGRRTCFARSPECERCTVAPDCPKVGVVSKAKKAAGKAAPGASKPGSPRRRSART